MEKVAKGRLLRLQTQIHERLGDDVRYSIKKTKQLPEGNRLETIVATAMGDGLVDLVREYRFELFRYIEAQLNPFVRKYEAILGEINYLFDPKAYQEEAAKSGILSTNYTLLAQNIKEKILSQKPKNSSSALEEVRKVIAQGFEPIQLRVLPLLFQSGEEMVLEIQKHIQKPIQERVEKIEQENRSLEDALLHVSQDRGMLGKRLENLKVQLSQIQALKREIASCMEVA